MLKAGKTRPRQGFTLIEIIIVLVLLAFSATMVLGLNLGQRDKYALRDFALSLGSYLQLARSTALAQGQSGPCFLDQEVGRITSPILDRTLTVPRGVGIGFQNALPMGDTDTPVLLVEFSMDGSASGADIVLESKGYTAVITVNPLLGDVTFRF